MTKQAGADTNIPESAEQLPSVAWIVYAASAWWILFAAMSFYWAVGGTFGLASLGEGIEELAAARERGWSRW